jgi:hypothetical protein
MAVRTRHAGKCLGARQWTAKEIFQTDDMKRPAMLLFTIGGNRGVLTADEKSNRGGRT